MIGYKNFYTCAVLSAFLLVLTSPITRVNGEEEGAPTEACVDMKPGHGTSDGLYNSQNVSSSPFKTEIPAGGYVLMGETVKLELRAKNPLIPFKGYLIMAFDVNDATKPIGTFKIPSDGKLINCTEAVENAATHQWHDDKQMVTVEWVPPTTNYMGTVIFRTTYVQSFTIFWVKTESIRVSYVMEIPTTKAPPSSASHTSSMWVGLITISLLTFLMR